eukprot:CAMPEP_0202459696 /NCGR_PEP_ID=MMETSP1360-20130828/37781_1 /ASSEMBLY_ACC=CAM_ASM_000848 /TAXON_ID=515479 /ORGANISM="Licmophora paradoxa, Strain CCMP2313" /LENGTH=122 /DNA_ID=CAMNT_0049080913 /DNA_START=179 /DNA_END=547 /DNA_ORIENTATION=-
MIIQVILEEQGKQRKMGITDPHGLQVLSRACSKQARERALLLGAQDEQDAKKIAAQRPREHQKRTRRRRRSTVVSISFDEDTKLSDSSSAAATAGAFVGRSCFNHQMMISDEERSGSSARSA